MCSRAAMFATVCFALGCATSQPVLRNERTDQHTERAPKRPSPMLPGQISQLCNSQESPPSVHLVEPSSSIYDHPPLEEPCGLVANEVATAAYTTRFADALCGGVVDQACTQKFSEMFFARLTERYKRADFGMLSLRCKAHPIECANIREFEIWTLTSHNEGVVHDRQEANRLEGEAAAAQARARDERIAAALRAFAQSSPQVTCITTSAGGVLRTTCQ